MTGALNWVRVSGRWQELHEWLVSGQTIGAVLSSVVEVARPTEIKTGFFRGVPTTSGGVVLHSGAVKSVILRNMGMFGEGLSGYLAIGGATNRPFIASGITSAGGVGYLLTAGQSEKLEVADLGHVYICAQVNGQIVTFLGA